MVNLHVQARSLDSLDSFIRSVPTECILSEFEVLFRHIHANDFRRTLLCRLVKNKGTHTGKRAQLEDY